MTAACPAARQQQGLPPEIVSAVELAGWSGVVLPKTKVSYLSVYPVIEPRTDVWRDRLAAGWGPETDQSTLLWWESWTEDLGNPPPASPLSITGFVSTARPREAIHAIWTLSGYGGGLIVGTGVRGPSTFTLMECDLNSIGFAWLPPKQDPALLVAGRNGPTETAIRGVGTRHKEELLFQWAIETSALNDSTPQLH